MSIDEKTVGLKGIESLFKKIPSLLRSSKEEMIEIRKRAIEDLEKDGFHFEYRPCEKCSKEGYKRDNWNKHVEGPGNREWYYPDGTMVDDFGMVYHKWPCPIKYPEAALLIHSF